MSSISNSFTKYFISKFNIIDFEGLKQFIIDNQIVGTTAGVILAYAALATVRSMVGDILLPLFYFFIIIPIFRIIFPISKNLDNGLISHIFEPVSKLDISNFLKELITFIFIVFTTFFFIQYLFKHLSKNETQITKNYIPNNDISKNDITIKKPYDGFSF